MSGAAHGAPRTEACRLAHGWALARACVHASCARGPEEGKRAVRWGGKEGNAGPGGGCWMFGDAALASAERAFFSSWRQPPVP